MFCCLVYLTWPKSNGSSSFGTCSTSAQVSMAAHTLYLYLQLWLSICVSVCSPCCVWRLYVQYVLCLNPFARGTRRWSCRRSGTRLATQLAGSSAAAVAAVDDSVAASRSAAGAKSLPFFSVSFLFIFLRFYLPPSSSLVPPAANTYKLKSAKCIYGMSKTASEIYVKSLLTQTQTVTHTHTHIFFTHTRSNIRAVEKFHIFFLAANCCFMIILCGIEMSKGGYGGTGGRRSVGVAERRASVNS